MARIGRVEDEADLARVRALFRAYAAGLAFDLASQGSEAELAGLPGRYAAPRGTLLLARDPAGAALGCVGVRPLAAGAGICEPEETGEPGICELKRLYVAPGGRGAGLGRALAAAALAFAASAGYRAVRLDTLPTMAAAGALYRGLGFASVPPPADDLGLGQIYFARALP